MPRKTLKRISAAIPLLVLWGFPALAQDTWTWPAKPSNVQVLPKDMPASQLRSVMTQFASTLGVRCSYCHKGEEGKPLSAYDFVSDENPNKDRAREMLRMLKDINAHLSKLQPSGDQRINMWCHTCHHGKPRPITLEEALMEQYRAKGIQATLDRYAELRKQYYGRDAYDFGEGSLNAVGYLVLEKDSAGAIRVLELNAKLFPQSGNVWDSLGEACLKAGDQKRAEESYEKSLTLDPTNENAKDVLKKIRVSREKSQPQ